MNPIDPPQPEPWHSPERAWVTVLWLIRVITLSLALVLFAPLIQQAVALA